MDDMSPACRVKLYRERAGLTQEAAANLAGVAVTTWSKWEQGQRYPSYANWIAIARVLRVRDLHELTGLPVHELPEVPTEHPALAAVRAALLNPAPDTPDDGLAGRVDTAYEVWQCSGAHNHARVGAALPGLVRSARRSGGEAATRVWMLTRAWAKWVGAHDVMLLASHRAVEAAGDAGPAAGAAAAWDAGMTLSTRGYTEESAEAARAAIRALEPRASEGGDELALLGALWLLLAVEAARLRDEHTAAVALDTAGRIAARTGETNTWRTVFGPTNVAIYRAATELEFGRAGAAARHGVRVDVSGLPSVERRYAHLLTVARAYALGRDDLAAAVLLRRAADEYPAAARSALPFRGLLGELLRRETPATRPELRPLAERLGVH